MYIHKIYTVCPGSMVMAVPGRGQDPVSIVEYLSSVCVHRGHK